MKNPICLFLIIGVRLEEEHEGTAGPRAANTGNNVANSSQFSSRNTANAFAALPYMCPVGSEKRRCTTAAKAYQADAQTTYDDASESLETISPPSVCVMVYFLNHGTT